VHDHRLALVPPDVVVETPNRQSCHSEPAIRGPRTRRESVVIRDGPSTADRAQVATAKLASVPPVTCMICEAPVLRFLRTAIAVAPNEPCGLADAWLAPSVHSSVDGRITTAALDSTHDLLQDLMGAWRHCLGCSGVNVMGYLGEVRADWPTHTCLRVIGRSTAEVVHPLRVLNGSEEPPNVSVSDLAATASSVAGDDEDVDRWNLRDPASECDCCNEFAVSVQQIATDGIVRMLQPRGVLVPGVLLMSPVRHVERLADLSHVEFVALLRGAEAANEMFTATLGTAGTYYFLNDGRVAGQESPHVHVHLHGRMPPQQANPFAAGSSVGIPDAPLIPSAALKMVAAGGFEGIWP